MKTSFLVELNSNLDAMSICKLIVHVSLSFDPVIYSIEQFDILHLFDN